MVFGLFLESVAFLLSLLGLVLIYLAVGNARDSDFVPVYYFIGLSLVSVMVFSLSRMAGYFFTWPILGSRILEDLLLAYVSLFLFGTLWQSYEAAMSAPPYIQVESD